MLFKIKRKNKNIIDDPLSEIKNIDNIEKEKIETFNILKNKNKWILMRSDEQRPIYSSSYKNDVIKKAKDICINKKIKINIFNINNEITSTKLID